MNRGNIMEVRLQKWGNSFGILIPKNLLNSLKIKENDVLKIEQIDDKFVISKSNTQKVSLRELFKNYHEQSGKRPGIVISHNFFNEHTNMCMVLPITSNLKEFPTHYILEDSKKINGSVLCEHIRSIDYEARSIRYVEKLSDNDLISVLTLMNACIEE